jgi:hypothetical protein
VSRLTIDLSDQQHKSLKALAALQGKTIRQYAIERLFPDEPSEDAAWGELRAFVADRIAQSEKEGPATETIDTILAEELGISRPA